MADCVLSPPQSHFCTKLIALSKHENSFGKFTNGKNTFKCFKMTQKHFSDIPETISRLHFLNSKTVIFGPPWRTVQEILSGTHGRFALTLPPQKKCWKSKVLVFFFTFFEFFRYMRPNTCPNIMILYPKGNSMFLNKFPTIIWYQNHFYCLSA